LAQFYNANKSPTKPTAEPSKFHPFTKKAKPKEASPEDLKRLFGPDWQKFV
jgi:hypothetical protein